MKTKVFNSPRQEIKLYAPAVFGFYSPLVSIAKRCGVVNIYFGCAARVRMRTRGGCAERREQAPALRGARERACGRGVGARRGGSKPPPYGGRGGMRAGAGAWTQGAPPVGYGKITDFDIPRTPQTSLSAAARPRHCGVLRRYKAGIEHIACVAVGGAIIPITHHGNNIHLGIWFEHGYRRA